MESLENPLAQHYSRFRVAERLLLTGHSHQAWPDAGFEGQQRAWLDAAEFVDDKWARAAEQAAAVRAGFARLIGDRPENIALGQSNETTFLRPATEGVVEAVATARHRGRTSWVWDVEMSDSSGRLCALTRMLIAVRPKEYKDAVLAARLLMQCDRVAPERGDYRERARRQVERAVKLCPQDGKAENNLAWTLLVVEELYDPNVDLVLDEVAKLSGQFGAARIIIEGHTDGSMKGQVPASLVKELSLNRANAVKEALVQKYPSLDPNRFAVEGMGWDRPADPNDPDNNAKNRRVEVKVYSAEKP